MRRPARFQPLPGDVQVKNIGLPKNVVCACLAETIVLALEGRFESFTVGRAIEWSKVHEIYQLGLKHGMKLAAISGVNGGVHRCRYRARAGTGAGRAGVRGVATAPRRETACGEKAGRCAHQARHCQACI